MVPPTSSHLTKSLLDEMPRKRREHRRNVALERQHQRSIRHHCNYCGSTKNSNMQMCSMCRAAFYCDRNCQTADYQRTHKEQCRNFARPPITRAFMTEPLCDDIKYAPDPVFAEGHDHGIGVWVSVTGSMSCGLGQLIVPMREPKDVSELMAHGSGPMKLKQPLNAYAQNLLTLQVLVQNRRRDKQPALIFATQSSVAVPWASLMPSSLGDAGLAGIRVRIARDPWTDAPRFIVKNFNGTEIADDASLPAAVVNKKQGIIELNVGEFVIMHMEFGLEDGSNARKEWQFLEHVINLSVPVLAPCAANARARRRTPTNDMALTQEVYAKLDRKAVDDYYSDYVMQGKHAFIRSHYGAEAAKVYAEDEQRMLKHGNALRHLLLGDPKGWAAFTKEFKDGTVPPEVMDMFINGVPHPAQCD